GTLTLQGFLNVLWTNSTSTFSGNVAVSGALSANTFSANTLSANTVSATTASSTNAVISSISGALLKTLSDGTVAAAIAGTDYSNFAYPFVSNATSTNINFKGGLAVGSSTPSAQFSIQANAGSTQTELFAIGSSTASATSTLFSVDNSGLTTVGDSSGSGDATFQFGSDAHAWSIGYNSSDQSFDIASSTNLSSNEMLSFSKSGSATFDVGLALNTVTNCGEALKTDQNGLIFCGSV